jgi:hypothetical protein
MTKIRRFHKKILLPLLFLLVITKCLITLILNIHDTTAGNYQLAANFSEFSKFPNLQNASNISAQNNEVNAMNAEAGTNISTSEQGSISTTPFCEADHSMQENLPPVTVFSRIQISDQPGIISQIHQVMINSLSPPTGSEMESDQTFATPDDHPSEVQYNPEIIPNLNPQSPFLLNVFKNLSSNLSKYPSSAKTPQDARYCLKRQQTSQYGSSSKPSSANQSISHTALAGKPDPCHLPTSNPPDHKITPYAVSREASIKSIISPTSPSIISPLSIANQITFSSMSSRLKDHHFIFSPFLQRKRRSRPSENFSPFSSLSTIAVIDIYITKESLEMFVSQYYRLQWRHFIYYASRISTYSETSLRVYIIYHKKKSLSSNIVLSSSFPHKVLALTFRPPSDKISRQPSSPGAHNLGITTLLLQNLSHYYRARGAWP